MGSTVEIAKKNDAVVYTCNEMAGYLSSKGIKTEGMHIGGRASLPVRKGKTDSGMARMSHSGGQRSQVREELPAALS